MSTLPIIAAASRGAPARGFVTGPVVSVAPSMPSMLAMYTDTYTGANAPLTETPWLDADSLDICIKSKGFHGVERVTTGCFGEDLS